MVGSFLIPSVRLEAGLLASSHVNSVHVHSPEKLWHPNVVRSFLICSLRVLAGPFTSTRVDSDLLESYRFVSPRFNSRLDVRLFDFPCNNPCPTVLAFTFRSPTSDSNLGTKVVNNAAHQVEG